MFTGVHFLIFVELLELGKKCLVKISIFIAIFG